VRAEKSSRKILVAATREPARRKKGKFSVAKILAVDDDPPARELLVALLTPVGHVVIEAADGAEALAKVHSERPDIVITDILMPTMDGFEFVRQLREDPELRDIPVFFWTATYHEREALALAESCGVRNIISKPAEPETILATVNATLQNPPVSAVPHAESFDREHLELVTDELLDKVKKLEAANFRLTKLLEVGRQLALEQVALRVLENFCHAAREITAARYASVGVLSEAGARLERFFMSGMTAETAARVSPPPLKQGVLARLLAGKRPLRLRSLGADPSVAEYPSPYLQDRSFLGETIASLKRTYGFVCLTEKLGAEEFSDEDAQVLSTLAAQAAVCYENARRYEETSELKDRLEGEKLYLEDEFRTEYNFEEIIGESPDLKRVLKQVETVAPTDATVLILGETGTGKELVARAIHNLSPRQGRTFVRLNCAAIPSGLLETELFGHEKGAFTGAIAQKIGRLELANHGTLFLDEVGDIPLELQPKLLRALQEREFERLGSTRTIPVDVRLIAATNQELERMVEERRFRSDLYFRLKVFPLHVPALRDRRGDVPILVNYFTQKLAHRMNKRIESIPPETMEVLSRWHWPGNVRELENFIERAVILSQGPVLRAPLAELKPAQEVRPVVRPGNEGVETLEAAERDHILRVLRETRGVIGGPTGAAARLGLKRTTLNSKLRKLGISRQDI
jgi:transcriptional regulator with GAF, ATPase, and Fis domain/CheY-like chemotaxis protein